MLHGHELEDVEIGVTQVVTSLEIGLRATFTATFFLTAFLRAGDTSHVLGVSLLINLFLGLLDLLLNVRSLLAICIILPGGWSGLLLRLLQLVSLHTLNAL